MTVNVTLPNRAQRGNYSALRENIQTGQLIAIRGRKGFAAKAVRLVTRSPYTHTAVAIWIGDRLMAAETAQGPASLVPISQYADQDFDVFPPPVCRNGLYARQTVLNLLGTRIDYAWWDLVRIVLHEWLRVPLPKAHTDSLICSSLSQLIYQRMGWDLPQGSPSLMTPRDLVQALQKPATLEIRCG